MSAPSVDSREAGLWLIALAAVLSGTLVGLVRSYARRAGVIDEPNDRSSHTAPTPRGGGIGVLGALVLTLAGYGVVRGVPWDTSSLVAMTWAVLSVAAIGWLDDHRTLGVVPRLVTHLLAALAVAWLSARWLPEQHPMLPWLAWWMLWTVSSINVLNFMDGIDGLVASQVAVFAAYAWCVASPGTPSRPLALATIGALVGFLVWNWSPARIFLGDVGSGALGALVVILGLSIMRDGADTGLVRAFLPLYPLFLDAATTIARRLARGERITTPHRSHLYQRLANGGWGHARTSLAFLVAALAGIAAGLAPDGVPRIVSMSVYLAIIPVVGLTLDRMVERRAM